MSKTKIVQLSVGSMMNYAYLVGDIDTKRCAVVDPSWDAALLMDAAQKEGWKITEILLTHTHFDHANALDELAEKTGATAYVHEDERGEVSAGLDVVTTKEGSEIALGNTTIECIHTPGHTPGSQCFIIGDAVITGDTLFVGACGRTDLPGGSTDLILMSLQRLATLPEETIVYPGHDYGGAATSTIGEQKKSNPFMDVERAKKIL